MHAGYDSGPLVADADLIIVIECDVPWYPHLEQDAAAGCQCRAYRRGPGLSALSDALVPERSCRSLRARRRAFEALDAALEQHLPSMTAASNVAASSRRTAQGATTRKSRRKRVAPRDKITPHYLSRAIGEAFGDDAMIFNEYPLIHRALPAREAGHFLRPRARRRPRLGPRRRARRQARRAGEARRRDPRATAPTCSPIPPWPLGAGQIQAAGADHHLQQQPLWRGAARHALDVQGRRGRRRRRPVPRRLSIRRRLRGIRARRRAAMASASKILRTCRAALQARARRRARTASRRCSMSSFLTELSS